MVEQVDGASHVGDRTGGALPVPVDDLLDGSITDAGMSTRGNAILDVGGQDHFVVGTVGAFAGGDDLVDVPAVVGTRAVAIGPVLQ